MICRLTTLRAGGACHVPECKRPIEGPAHLVETEFGRMVVCAVCCRVHNPQGRKPQPEQPKLFDRSAEWYG